MAGGDQQDQSKDVEHPGEAVGQGTADEDERGAGDHGEDNDEEEPLSAGPLPMSTGSVAGA